MTLSDRFGILGHKNVINRCWIIFKYAVDNQLIKQSVIFGQSFDRPSVKMIRGSRNKAGPRMFESHELKEILDSPPQKKCGRWSTWQLTEGFETRVLQAFRNQLLN